MDAIFSGFFLALTGLIYLLVAFLASRGVKSQADYLLGSRNFSTFSITLTLLATQLGAGMIFGTAAQAYEQGFWGLSYNLGMALGLIVLGFGVGPKLRDLEINTTAELFEKKFNSPSLRKLAALISILTMGGILAAQIVASRQLFSSLFDLSPVWLVGFWLVVIFYTMFGGIKAVIATDIFQVIMILTVFIGVGMLIIPKDQLATVVSNTASSSVSFNGGFSFFSGILVTVFFSLIEQDLAQRFFAAKNRRVAGLSALLASALLMSFAAIPLFLGFYAKSLGIVPQDGQSVLVLLLQSKLSGFGITIVSCALLAAICSTADSLLGAASSNLIADFGISEKAGLMFSRLATFVVGGLALIIAFKFDNIINLILKSYAISVSALFVPLLVAMFYKKPSKAGAQLSVSMGFAAFILLQLVSISLDPVLIALAFSTLGYLAGSIYEAKLNS